MSLESISPVIPEMWLQNQALSTTLGVGGPALWLAPVQTAQEVLTTLAVARQLGLPWWVLGGGSNVVVDDAGLPGVVIQPRAPQSGIAVLREDAEQVEVRVAAGLDWDQLVAYCVARGWQGIECLSGIPGQVGAAPIQNIGAYGQEVGEVLVRVHGVDCVGLAPRIWDKQACALGYRDSIFKRSPQGAVVLAVDLQLWRDRPACFRYAQVQSALTESASLGAVRQVVLDLRRSKGMVAGEGDPDARSCGSFFTNPVVSAGVAGEVRARLCPSGEAMPAWPQEGGQVKLSAAWLIERSGWQRGDGQGAVGLSTKHTLAIINRGGATATEVWNFAHLVAARVLERSGVQLEPEARRLED